MYISTVHSFIHATKMTSLWSQHSSSLSLETLQLTISKLHKFASYMGAYIADNSQDLPQIHVPLLTLVMQARSTNVFVDYAQVWLVGLTWQNYAHPWSCF